MDKATIWFNVFEYREKILPSFLAQLDLDLVVHSEIEAQPLIELPAELVIFDRGDNAEHMRVRKEIAC